MTVYITSKIGASSTPARAETLTYTDTSNQVLGPLTRVPAPINEVTIWIIEGLVQEYGVDYTARQVVGGSAPGYYVCVGTASAAPGGGTFLSGSNPTVGIATELASGDRMRLVYPT